MKKLTEILMLLCAMTCSVAVELKCDFKMYTERTSNGYNCKVEKNLVVTNKNTSIDKVTGTHVGRWSTNKDVERLYFLNIVNMKYVPVGYSKFFTSLSNIWIANCPIKSISSSDFENAPSVKIIGLRDTNIDIIDSEVFSRLENLHSLYLYNNQITKIEEAAFSKLTNLKSLNLANNKLGFLPAKLFENNKNLQEICINNNKLKIIESGIFAGLTELTKVDFKSNVCVSKSFPGDIWTFASFLQLLSNECSNPLSETIHELKQLNANSEVLIDKLESEKVKMDNKITNSTVEIEKMTIENKNLKIELDILHANHSEAQIKIEEIVNKTQNIENDLFKKNKSLEKALEEKTALSTEIESLNEKFERLHDEHAVMADENSKFLAEMAEIESNLTSLQNERIFIEDEIDHLKLNQSELLNEIEKKDLVIARMDSQLNSSAMLQENESGIFVTPMEILCAAAIFLTLIMCVFKVVTVLTKKKRYMYNASELEVVFGNGCREN